MTEHGLPFVDVDVSVLFQHLGIGNVLHILSHIMLEGSLLLYSESPVRLSESSAALMALLRPLEWRMVYVPVLPESMLDWVDAPTVFVMGAQTAAVADRLGDMAAEVLRVDLDNDVIVAANVPLLMPNARALHAQLRRLLCVAPQQSMEDLWRDESVDGEVRGLCRSSLCRPSISLFLLVY